MLRDELILHVDNFVKNPSSLNRENLVAMLNEPQNHDIVREILVDLFVKQKEVSEKYNDLQITSRKTQQQYNELQKILQQERKFSSYHAIIVDFYLNEDGDMRVVTTMGGMKEDMGLGHHVKRSDIIIGNEAIIVNMNGTKSIMGVREPMQFDGAICKVSKILDGRRILASRFNGGEEMPGMLRPGLKISDVSIGSNVRIDLGSRIVYEIFENKPDATRFSLSNNSGNTFSNVGGLFEAKKELRKKLIIPLKNPAIFENYDIRPIRGILLYGPPGCHIKGQGILMYDGSIKMVEDIIVGDKLMGPDSTPRDVKKLIRGIGKMKKIKPIKGAPFIVNDEHILSLSTSYNEGNYKKDNVVDISVNNWEKLTNNAKHFYKLFRVGVEFTKKELPLDPYFLGTLLGDGSMTNGVGLTTEDAQIKQLAYDVAEEYGLNVRAAQAGGKSMTYYMSSNSRGEYHNNKIIWKLRELSLYGSKSGNKFIPFIYKTSDRNDRLNILAGLMDTDGSVHGQGFDYTSKSEQLAEDVVFIAKSLGLAAYMSPCQKSSQNGTIGNYFRVGISGDCSVVPTRLLHKITKQRKQKKNVLKTGFTVESLNTDKYYGFMVDGDNRYLLDDFTVTHNCGKTLVAGAIFNELVNSLKGHVPEDKMAELQRTHFFFVSGPEVLSKWVGEGEETIRNIFRAAKEASLDGYPAVIFWDEIDSVARTRQETHAYATEKTIVPTLLSELNGLNISGNVVLIAATNRPDLLDPALLRAGRLGDLKLEIRRPNREETIDIITKYLKPEYKIQDGSYDECVNAIIDTFFGDRVLGNIKLSDGSEYVITPSDFVSGASLNKIIQDVLMETALKEASNEGSGISKELLKQFSEKEITEQLKLFKSHNIRDFITLPESVQPVSINILA